jgi:hypothetical protein
MDQTKQVRLLRRLFKGGGTTSPSAGGNTPFVITATVDSGASNVAMKYAPLKYNKRMALHLTADDGGSLDPTIADVLSKNSAGYTDGAGTALLKGFTYALTSLVNGRPDRDGTTNPEITPWTGYIPLLKQRHLGISNHSSLHSPFNPDNPIATLPVNQIKDAEAMIYNRLGRIPRTVTVPGGFDGFAMAMASLDTYLGCESEGYGPNGSYAGTYQPEIRWLDKVTIPWAPTNNKWVLSRKFINQDWGTPLKAWFDEKAQLATDEYNAGNHTVLSAFDHFPATQVANFGAFLNYVQTHPLNVGGDAIWYPNFQEFLEYEEVKRLCVIPAPVINGNTLTWTIARSALPSVSLYHDMTLLLTGAKITKIEVTGADTYTSNLTNGLLNIMKLGTPSYTTTGTPSTQGKADIPTVDFNLDTRILSATAPVNAPLSPLEYRHGQSGVITPYSGGLLTDGQQHEENEWQFRTAASNNKLPSDWVGSKLIPAKTTTTNPGNPSPPPTPIGVTPGVDSDPALADAAWNSGTRIAGEIPYVARDTYFVGDVHDGDFAALNDDSTAPYYGNARIRNVSPVKISLRRYKAKLTSLQVTTRLTSGDTKFYYIQKGSWDLKLIGTIGANVQGVTTLNLPTALTDVTYVVIQPPAHSDYPSELNLIGSYVKPIVVSRPLNRRKLRFAIGTNAFLWDGMGKGGTVDVGPDTVNPLKEKALSQNGILRHYLDRSMIEPEKGVIMFNPSNNKAGSFNCDGYYQMLKKNGIDVRACIKNFPAWGSATWPENLRTSEQLNVEWQGDLATTKAWAERPEAYLSGGKLWFQYVARYGSVVIADALLNVNQSTTNGYAVNQKRTGLGLVSKGEAGNENDSDWRGEQGYANGRMMAAMCSAYLDGHMGTLGAGVGCRAADPNFDLSFPGVATATLEHYQGAIDWCREFRGYNSDGTVNLSWTTANYHAYSTDQGITQVGAITRARAPELTGYGDKMESFLQFSFEEMRNMKVVLGEHGSDITEKSSQGAVRPIDIEYDAQGNVLYYPEYDANGNLLPDKKVVPLRKLRGDRTARYMVQAQWIMRERLLGWLKGMAEMQCYMHKDANDPPSEYDRYSGCGTTNADETLRASGYVSYQFVHTFGDFTATNVLSTSPYIVQATDGQRIAYFIWSPTETNATALYQVPLPYGGTQYTPNLSDYNFTTSPATATGQATEMPIVILANAAPVGTTFDNGTTTAQPAASSFTYETTPYSEKYPSPLVVREDAGFTGAGPFIIEGRNFRNDNGLCADIYMPNGQQVILRGCVFATKSQADFLHITDDTRIRVENCRFYADGDQAIGVTRGRAFYAYAPKNVVFINNYMLNTAGAKIEYWSNSPLDSDTLLWNANRYDNICGGTGGDYRQALQCQHFHRPNMEIAWNWIENVPGASRVEDNFNFGEAGGMVDSTMKFHHNCINGAFPANPFEGGFTGTGFTTDAGGTDRTPSQLPSFIDAYGNVVVRCMNACMNIAAGHDNHYHDNLCVVSGVNAQGVKYGGVNNAVANWKSLPYSDEQFFNNSITNNIIKVNVANGEQPYYNNPNVGPGSVALVDGNTLNTYELAATYQDELDAIAGWQQLVTTQQRSIGVLPANTPAPSAAPTFTFTTVQNTTTSLGVFSGDTLIRTLYNNQFTPAGTQTGTWNGKNDEGVASAPGPYVVRRLKKGQLQYDWEGARIGNTSTAISGNTRHKAFQGMRGMAISGGMAYYCTNYDEGWSTASKFSLNNIQSRSHITQTNQTNQGAQFVATDGVLVYWAGPDCNAQTNTFIYATRCSDDSEVTDFPAGAPVSTIYGRTYPSAIARLNTPEAAITGLAVQKNGNLLLVARAALSNIYVHNKATGELITIIGGYSNPRYMVFDNAGGVWLNSYGNALTHHTIDANGSFSGPNISLSGLVNPLDLDVSPDGAIVAICDGNNGSEVIRAYNTNNGSVAWTFGNGSYTTDPTVANDKFFWVDRNDIPSDTFWGFICFAPDGSFWVGDGGNCRAQHYTADRTFIDRIMYVPHSYSVVVDKNNPKKLFNGLMEFDIDYSKKLDEPGAWTLVRNYRGAVPDAFNREGHSSLIVRSLVTLSNRTYGLMVNTLPNNNRPTLIEFPLTAPLRLTSAIFGVFANVHLTKTGALRRYVNTGVGGTATVYESLLTGFDSANDPQWGAEKMLTPAIPVTIHDPQNQSGATIGQSTDSGKLIFFNSVGEHPNADGDGSGYHLGAFEIGGKSWGWRGSLATGRDYTGPFPTDGRFDTGNGVNASGAGGDVTVLGNNIFWNYKGENWKGSQTNYWNHFDDNGLMIGQFGQWKYSYGDEAIPEVGGNVQGGSVVNVDGVLYLYHNDEGINGGVHRWKISGMDTISYDTKTVVLA